jgi:hypothetical protein
MACIGVNPYNGKVLKTFDDMTDPDIALWLVLRWGLRIHRTLRKWTKRRFMFKFLANFCRKAGPRKMSDEELLRFGRAAAGRTFIPGTGRR